MGYHRGLTDVVIRDPNGPGPFHPVMAKATERVLCSEETMRTSRRPRVIRASRRPRVTTAEKGITLRREGSDRTVFTLVLPQKGIPSVRAAPPQWGAGGGGRPRESRTWHSGRSQRGHAGHVPGCQPSAGASFFAMSVSICS